jgi:hypothetical protein
MLGHKQSDNDRQRDGDFLPFQRHECSPDPKRPGDANSGSNLLGTANHRTPTKKMVTASRQSAFNFFVRGAI